jgi:FtsH-binding integral membrane protein
MKLICLNPFAPREPIAQAKFIAIFKRELTVYRKKPTFWVSMIIVLICSLFLISRLDTIERLIALPIVFGLALVHDTITSHFVKRLAEKEE